MLPQEGNETPERVFYEAASRLLDVQIATNEQLDTKLAAIFSVGSTILPVTFGLLSLAPERIPDNASRVLLLALIAYGLLLACAWYASTFRALEYRPDLQTLAEHTPYYEGESLLQWVALEYMDSTIINGWELEDKARWTGWANTALYVEGFLLSTAAVLTLL